MARFGFVGVGLMGHGMAANLLKGGHEVQVIAHRNRQPVEDLVARGATEAKSLPELASGKDAVFICVANTPQVETVVAGLEPALGKGQYVIETGTSDPNSTVRLADRLAARGVVLVDAPMGGGAQHAAAGELASLVGATPEHYAAVEPWIRCYSKICVNIGPVGAGHRAKLLNNLLALGQGALVVDAYRIARAEGIDWAKLFEVNMGGAARSGALERIIVPALKGDYRGYLFALENAEKDLRYYVEYARQVGLESGLGEAFRRYFEEAARTHGATTMLSELLKPDGKP